jgi:transposase
MSEDAASPTKGKRSDYRPTTADQRRRLFAVDAETDNPRQAAAAAPVGVGTLYYWRERCEPGGYPALEQPRSQRPPPFARQLREAVRDEGIAAKQEHPEWGRQRLADERRKAHGGQAGIRPAEVRRMLSEAGRWPQVARLPKAGRPSPATPKDPTRR